MKRTIHPFKTLLIFSFMTALAFNASAQVIKQNKRKIGVAMGSSVSGNGHGLLYIPQLVVSNNRNSLLFGTSIQKEEKKLTGVRVAYSFILNFKTKNDEEEEADENPYQYFKDGDLEPLQEKAENKINFKFYAYSEYLKNNLLSRGAQKMEAHVKRIEGQNWKATRLSTIEAGLGFQIGARLAKNLYWNTFIAASFYYHTTYIQNMHHERFSPSITFGTNITIPSFRDRY